MLIELNLWVRPMQQTNATHHFKCNIIGDEGAKTIGEGLKANSSLKEINLRETNDKARCNC